MHLGTEGFVDHAKTALQDAPLQEALHLLTNNFVPRRVAAMAALGNAEALRTGRGLSRRTRLPIWIATWSSLSPS